MVGQRPAHRLLARKRRDRDARRIGPGDGHLGGKLVFGGAGDDVLELHFELVEQVLMTLGRLTPLVLLRLRDAQLEILDDGVGVGNLGLGDSGKRLGLKQFGPRDEDVPTLGDQRCLENFDIVRKGLEARVHRGSFYSRKPSFCRGASSRKPQKSDPFSPPAPA